VRSLRRVQRQHRCKESVFGQPLSAFGTDKRDLFVPRNTVSALQDQIDPPPNYKYVLPGRKRGLALAVLRGISWVH
jgi:hypothetical protein